MTSPEERRLTARAVRALAEGQERIRVTVYLDGGTNDVSAYRADWLVETLCAAITGSGVLTWHDGGLTVTSGRQQVLLPDVHRPVTAGE